MEDNSSSVLQYYSLGRIVLNDDILAKYSYKSKKPEAHASECLKLNGKGYYLTQVTKDGSLKFQYESSTFKQNTITIKIPVDTQTNQGTADISAHLSNEINSSQNSEIEQLEENQEN